MRILIVDDDDSDRLAVRRCIRQCGLTAELDEAASAQEAQSRIAPERYDCVLLDYYLPGADTVSLLRRMRETAKDTPVVILTGRGDENIAVEFMKSGAADYVPKASLTPERLAASIRYALEMTRAAAGRRTAEREVREQEDRFRTLANAIPQLAWMADAQGDIRWYNQRWYDYTGTTLEQVQGWGWRVVQHPEHEARVVAGIKRSFETGEPWEDTFPLRAADGTYRWFLSRALPMRRDDGTITGWFGTNTDITAQKRVEDERELLLAREQQARTAAEQATRAREEVLAVLAHDLRDPMQTIFVAASVLGIQVPEENRRHVAIIQRATQSMQRLVTDLLDVARIDSGTFSVRKARVDLAALLQDVLELYEPQALAHDVVLGSDIDSEVAPVEADPDRLRQVLSNLISNALKFTPAKGNIVVRVANREGGVEMSVKDSGPGIAEEDLTQIFERFWQLNRASRTGAGLGLAICKGIVEAHGGRVWAESKPGRGSTFYVYIPRKPATGADS